MTSSAADHRRLSPEKPYAVLREREAIPDGRVADVLTLFLTATRCPLRCVMCDLWKNTLDRPMPAGAIPRQIMRTLRSLDATARRQSVVGTPLPLDVPRHIKLYNSGNFFDPGSIPPADHAAIFELCDRFERVVIENHPRVGRRRLQRLPQAVRSRLQIAVGLETVVPRGLDRLNKRFTRDDFDRYTRLLATLGVSLRVFLIVGLPGQTPREARRWSKLSIRYAIDRGADHVSLIPARVGNGWAGQANRLPRTTIADLNELQQFGLDVARVRRGSQRRSVITVDLWDTDPLRQSDQVRALVRNIERQNLTQQPISDG